MQALFIGHAYVDVTFLTDHIPSGDEKYVAQDYAVSFGGNAVTAAFVCANLGIVPDLLCTLADDWLARMFRDMSAKYKIPLHSRKVAESSLSFVIPRDGKRAIVRCRDDNYLHPFPPLNMNGCRALHIDGHQPDAAMHYAKLCREQGILTSLDGGAVRDNTDELLEYIDVAVVSELFCEQLGKTPHDAMAYMASKGVKIAAVTLGSKGVVWREEDGEIFELPALKVPMEKVTDTNGAGDTFHGAYVYSWLAAPDKCWEEHFAFARAASAHAIQHLGNEASLPSLEDIAITRREYEGMV
jgi:sugar/nucleoside kinase (ribokinase family)